MPLVDEIRAYLPRFLSAESDKELFESLKQFPANIDCRIYTDRLLSEELLFQGDGLRDLLVINLPDRNVMPAPGMILSNTCDVDLNNQRAFFPPRLVYAPIFNLEKYRRALLEETAGLAEEVKKTKTQAIDSHIGCIREQKVTQVFYLPKLPGHLEESIVFLDRICNCDNAGVSRENIQAKRLFTLSDYGAYLFLIKLSIHFTRITDKVDRGSIKTL